MVTTPNLYRVKPGFVLPHQGEVLKPGATVELLPHVAADPEIHYRLELVSEAVPEPPAPGVLEAQTDEPPKP
jgi:hypothetical protein